MTKIESFLSHLANDKQFILQQLVHSVDSFWRLVVRTGSLMGKSCSKDNAIAITEINVDTMETILTEAAYKTRLEQKLCVFKETPEPICDLSECNLDKLPGNSLFAMVKVLRKEILILGKNRLKSLASGGPLSDLELLQVLDLSHNKFKVLPIEIGGLKNLRVSH